ncbi:MAG: magnesium transporter [Rickettsiaceae bacterium]|nr:MAG: magnesium transporter [Rickettsiaceae bacterium]
MNKEIQNSMLFDHEDQFAELFEQIADLINNNDIEKAINHLSQLHFADLADFLDNTNHKIYKKILPPLADIMKAKTLVYLSDSSKQPVIEALGFEKSAELLDQLDIEEVIEVIEVINKSTKKNILAHLSKVKNQQILEGFNYPEDSVGRVLEKNFVAFSDTWSIGQALDFIRNSDIKNDFHAAIIVDYKYRPVGNILLSTLLKNSREKFIKDLMNCDLKIAGPYTELDEIAFIFKQYALTIVPIVNKSGRLIGSVSIDNMIYIIEEQTERDIMQLGGVHSQDIFYNLFYTVRHRFPWLFVNLITACLTSTIIDQFSDTIAKLISLAAMMPIVASLGGNAGTQAMTVTVRALANKDINNANMFRVVIKEILVCASNGILLACIGGLLSFVIMKNSDLSIVFTIAIIVNFLVAGFCGSTIPITLHNFNIDPATASGVFLTALTDGLGFFTLLGLAYFFLV